MLNVFLTDGARLWTPAVVRQSLDTTKLLWPKILMDPVVILNDRELAATRDSLRSIEGALAPEKAFALSSSGIAVRLIEKHAEMLRRRRDALRAAVDSYESLKAKNEAIIENWRNEPGVALVLARIFRGLSQRQLAESLGMREQQVQRYEADRYRSISLSNFRRICSTLGVSLSLGLAAGSDTDVFVPKPDRLDAQELRKVLSYVREAGWLPKADTRLTNDDNVSALINYASSVRDRFGGVSLFRKGKRKSSDVSLLAQYAWRARVSDLTQDKLSSLPRFDPTDIGWLRELVQLSRNADGPRQAVSFLQTKGILLVVVPAIPGTALDGAAFLEGSTPVVGMTLRYDRVDYFWFTLLHELGHVFLHLDHGLTHGFFDDVDSGAIDAVEEEANDFAASCVVAPELWRLSPARLATTSDVVENLARQLGISASLIFGKIRRERDNYKIFSRELGQGTVRRLFFEEV